MAKKKNIKKKEVKKENIAQKEINVESMKSKVEIKQPNRRDQERISRLVGSLFIGVGVLLVAFGVYSFIRFREEPVLDESLSTPIITDITTLTNSDSISIKGRAEGFDSVFVYVNNQKKDSVRVNTGSTFDYTFKIDSEGTYTIALAGIKGFPSRVVSKLGESKPSTVDWTAPSKDSLSLKYSAESNKGSVKISGSVEPNSTVEIKRGTAQYTTIANSDGEFLLTDVVLDEGKNVFSIVLKDQAGNEVTLDEKIRIEYSKDADVNGDAATDENIPQADGELSLLIDNNLMLVFGILALISFIASATFVLKKKSL